MHKLTLLLLFALLPFFWGCHWKPSHEYQALYSHLNFRFNGNFKMQETDYFLVILVDAPHLDYTNNTKLLQTIIKHPNGCQRRDFGHAWIFLKGIIDGIDVYVEGGHSGELGLMQAKYFDGIMNNIDYGETNPIKYLWSSQRDGFFEEGSGIHFPTFAAKIDLTKEEFDSILHLLQREYNYSLYSLTANQCCSLVAQAAEIAHLRLDYQNTISIDPCLKFAGEWLPLWKDPEYSLFTFGCPDILEKSLIHAVLQGKAEYALPWYLRDFRDLRDNRDLSDCLPKG